MANGFLSAAMGGIGGAADAAQRQARGFIEDERKLDLTKQLSQIEEQREMRLMEARERANFEGKRRDVTELGPERQRIEREGKQAEFEQDLGNAPRKAASEAESAKVKSRAAREATAEAGKDKGYLGGLRAEAQAKHVESASSAANAEATRFDTATKRKIQGLKTEYANAIAQGDEKLAEQIQRRIEAESYTPSGKGNSEYDVEKVTETTDPLTGELSVKRERTERRKPNLAKPSGSPAPARVPENDAVEQARAAIARGAPRDAVNARLRQQGYKAQL